MAYEKTLSDCSIKVKQNVGTTSSGSTSTHTDTFGGANISAEAQTIMDFVNAFQAVISTPVIEVLRVDNYLVADSDEEVNP